MADPAQQAEALVQRGEVHAAAVLLRQHGHLARAQELYEQLWDFPGAIEVARERGDLAAALRLALEGRDLGTAEQIFQQLLGADLAAQAAAAEVLERRREFERAARLRAARGDLAAAQALYLRAGLPLLAGQLAEQGDAPQQAMEAYQEVLQQAGAGGREQGQAHLGLGRILLRFGQHEEAARHLQAARRAWLDGAADVPGALPGEVAAELDRRLIRALLHLRYRDAAAQVWARLARSLGPALPSLDELAAEGDAPAAAAGTQGASSAAPQVLLSRYQIVRLLGSGGMGRVYLARDLLHQREVAIKVVPPPLYGAPGGAGYARFVREAQVIGALNHPGIVRLLDFHEAEGLLVMEHLAGGALQDRPLPLPAPLCRSVLLQVIDGLSAAHKRGVIHRDLKPANVFLTATLEARLGDFGVAHLQELDATQTAGFVGTLAYMAPEQIRGSALTVATDLYGLGVTAFQLLTGRLPFLGPDFAAQHLQDAPPAPTALRGELDPAWDAVCLRLLAKDPAERFAGLDELRRALERIPAGASAPGPGADLDPAPAAPDAPSRPPVGPAPRGLFAAALDGPLIDQTPHSTLHLCHDSRLQRPVIVERFAPGQLSAGSAGGEAQLRWLRALARLGGPLVQRVLHLYPDQDLAIFEAIQGPSLGPGADLPTAAREALLRVLRQLHRDGLSHGAVARSLVREAWAPVLLVAGRGPLGPDHRARPEQDLEDLSAFTSC